MALSICTCDRKSAEQIAFPEIFAITVLSQNFLSKKFHNDSGIVFDWKRCVRLQITVRKKWVAVCPELVRKLV